MIGSDDIRQVGLQQILPVNVNADDGRRLLITGSDDRAGIDCQLADIRPFQSLSGVFDERAFHDDSRMCRSQFITYYAIMQDWTQCIAARFSGNNREKRQPVREMVHNVGDGLSTEAAGNIIFG
jgi:hypothetical protein